MGKTVLTHVYTIFKVRRVREDSKLQCFQHHNTPATFHSHTVCNTADRGKKQQKVVN